MNYLLRKGQRRFNKKGVSPLLITISLIIAFVILSIFILNSSYQQHSLYQQFSTENIITNDNLEVSDAAISENKITIEIENNNNKYVTSTQIEIQGTEGEQIIEEEPIPPSSTKEITTTYDKSVGEVETITVSATSLSKTSQHPISSETVTGIIPQQPELPPAPQRDREESGISLFELYDEAEGMIEPGPVQFTASWDFDQGIISPTSSVKILLSDTVDFGDCTYSAGTCLHRSDPVSISDRYLQFSADLSSYGSEVTWYGKICEQSGQCDQIINGTTHYVPDGTGQAYDGWEFDATYGNVWTDRAIYNYQNYKNKDPTTGLEAEDIGIDWEACELENDTNPLGCNTLSYQDVELDDGVEDYYKGSMKWDGTAHAALKSFINISKPSDSIEEICYEFQGYGKDMGVPLKLRTYLYNWSGDSWENTSDPRESSSEMTFEHCINTTIQPDFVDFINDDKLIALVYDYEGSYRSDPEIWTANSRIFADYIHANYTYSQTPNDTIYYGQATLPDITNITISQEPLSDGYQDCSEEGCAIMPQRGSNATNIIINVTIYDEDDNFITNDPDAFVHFCLEQYSPTQPTCNEDNADYVWRLQDMRKSPALGDYYYTLSTGILTEEDNTPEFYIAPGLYSMHVNVTEDGEELETDPERDDKWEYISLIDVAYRDEDNIEVSSVRVGSTTIELGTWNSGDKNYTLVNYGNVVSDLLWESSDFTCTSPSCSGADIWELTGYDFEIDDDTSHLGEPIEPGPGELDAIYVNQTQRRFVYETGLDTCSNDYCADNNLNETLETYWHINPPADLTPGIYESQIDFTVSAPTLRGYWKFDEELGSNILDSSTYGNDGILTTPYPSRIDGLNRGALNFTGTDGHVRIFDNESLDIQDKITIEFMFLVEELPTTYTQRIFRKFSETTDANFVLYYWGPEAEGSHPNEEYRMALLGTTGGSWNYQAGVGGLTGLSQQFGLNQWYHFAATYDHETGGQLFINGEPQGVHRPPDGLMSVNDHNVWIGRAFNGLIDEVKIHNRIVDSEEFSVPQDTKAGHWKFDEGSGIDAFDSSSYHNDGVLGDGTCTPGNGECPTWVDSVNNKALQFDGTDDYVDCGVDSSLNIIGSEITVEALIKLDNLNEHNLILSNVESTTGGYQFLVRRQSEGGDLIFNYHHDGTHTIIENGLATISPNEWHHVAFAGSSLFVDGVEYPSTAPSIKSSVNNFQVGSNLGMTGLFASSFSGIIDEVKVYNRVLGLEEFEIPEFPTASLTDHCQFRSSCDPGEFSIFSISDNGNAHIEEVVTDYSDLICCPGSDLNNNCVGGEIILHLTDSINAHAFSPEYSGPYTFTNEVCLGTDDATPVDCGMSSGTDYYCIISISDLENAHVGPCGTYPNNVYCKVG